MSQRILYVAKKALDADYDRIDAPTQDAKFN